MTNQLFRTATELPPAEPAERLGRWVLNRAGIVNVWQYDRVELSFSGGRVLLRGSNGAGKSKALEVLLPFLLDGDTRSIDAAGRDRTTVTWLMTDGREPGNHVGYVWLELRMTTAEASGVELTDRYLTIGAGLKASSSTRQSSTWFFMTEEARVGEALHLGPDMSVDRLREQLGAEALTQTGAEHRRRVAARLFDVADEARYQSLVHLLHRLRDPNIGNRVDAGELAAVLREALPPLSDVALDKAAERFETLDQIREQLERIERTAVALDRFLKDYAGYAKSRLAERAAAVAESGARLERARREQVRHVADVTRIAAELSAAEEHVLELRDETARAAAELEALQSSEAYQQHRQLDDRRRAVASKSSEAATAAGAARDQAEMAASLATQMDDAATRADELARAVEEARTVLERTAKVSGLDAAVVPANAEGIPAAEQVAVGRRRAAEQIRILALAAARAGEDADRLGEQAARSEAELAARNRETEAAEVSWYDATAGFAAAVTQWADRPLPAILHDAAGPTADTEALENALRAITGGATEEDLATLAGLAREVVAPVKAAARALEIDAEAAHSRAAEELAALAAEHARLEAEPEARPPRSRFREAERDAQAGAPFYELVDIRPDLSPEDAAGVEAALEASGLLDAWVSARGIVVHPSTRDVLWRADAPPLPEGVRSLADVLVPLTDQADHLLRSVALEPGDTPVPYATVEGRWSLPPLSGAWKKPSSDFLGATARRATRARRLADLEAQMASGREVLAAAAGHREDARGAVRSVEQMLLEVPDDSAVRAAAADARAAAKVAEAASARHDDDRRSVEQARNRAAIARNELTHAAAADSLPAGIDDLDTVIVSAGELASGLRSWQRQWHELGRLRVDADGLRERHTERENVAMVAAERAAALERVHEHEELALNTLEEAIGSSVEDVLRQISEAQRRKASATEAEPSAQVDVTRLAGEHGEARARHTEAGRAVEETSAALAEAGDRLAAALGLPGVADAAIGAEWEHNSDDPVGSAAALSERLGEFAAVSDGVILNRLHELEAGLAGGYDVVSDEVDGVKFVLVADDLGRQPLPNVATRVSAEAAAARERLAAGERETIERFLLGELGEEVRERLLEAHDLVRSANQALGSVRSSHGLGAHLEWSLDDDAGGPARTASRLLVMSPRSQEEDAELRDALMELIRAERESDPAAGYAEHLRTALDYRRWYRFTVKVTNDAQPGSARVLSSRLGLSQGEQRVLSYLALFAAASAHFDSLGTGCPRLLLLDDAFAKVDEPTHGRLLALLIKLDLDFVITSERMWGCFPEVPSLDIYEALRDPAAPGVALVHFHWDGYERHLVGIP